MAGKEKLWYLRRCARSMGAGAAVLVLLCMLLAQLTMQGIVPEKWLNPCASLSVFFSALAACTLSVRGTVKKLPMCLGTAAALLLMLLLLALVVFGGPCLNRIGPVSAASMAGAAVALLGSRRGRKRRTGGEHKVRKRTRRRRRGKSTDIS